MCNYSLEGHASRKAIVGEVLVTASLGDHGTVGMVSEKKPDELVCVPPGSRLMVVGVPKNLATELAISRNDFATFVTSGVIDTYADGLRFDHHIGSESRPINLQDILGGMRVEVMSIPIVPAEVPERSELDERVLELA